MAKYANATPGARGINMKDGSVILVESKSTIELDPKDVATFHPDIQTDAKADQGKPGLTGKSKAALLDIAKDEGVPDVSDAMTVADITSAIELHREG